MPVPPRLDWEAAGGFAEVFSTAYDALFTQCGLSSGDRLLVHGAAGGVGTAAVQLGVATGARVTATVRNHTRVDDVAGLGAWAIPPEDFADLKDDIPVADETERQLVEQLRRVLHGHRRARSLSKVEILVIDSGQPQSAR
jgi:NADPH:quinone reductase-like Zn-dependent oxidoreductase